MLNNSSRKLIVYMIRWFIDFCLSSYYIGVDIHFDEIKMNCREGDETFTERKPRRDSIPCHVVVNDGDSTQLTRICTVPPHDRWTRLSTGGRDFTDVRHLLGLLCFFFQISRPKKWISCRCAYIVVMVRINIGIHSSGGSGGGRGQQQSCCRVVGGCTAGAAVGGLLDDHNSGHMMDGPECWFQ